MLIGLAALNTAEQKKAQQHGQLNGILMFQDCHKTGTKTG